jgi:alginate O-acetyltransferase complex protein AlgI
MLFSSYEFIFLFLPVTLGIFLLLTAILREGKWHRRIVLTWLLLASLFFYSWWNPAYLPLLLTSISCNFALSQLMLLARSVRVRQTVLATGVTANLLLLFYYKYAGFVAADVLLPLGIAINFNKPMLPLAISFFTFQQIDYLVDTYRRNIREKSLLTYATFVALFPHLIAGPIVLYRDLVHQLKMQPRLPLLDVAAKGLLIFTIGLFKKVALADALAPYASATFDKADGGQLMSMGEAWAGALSYTFQLYFDFSGYSDMAIGAALLFGLRLPQNFNSPYRATSIIEFWRRWHMTLSRFLREHLYIPLGGNRKGSIRRYINLLITMGLGGIWHGAGWGFLIWGLWHGGALALNRLWREKFNFSLIRINGVFAYALTMLVVITGWVFFRAGTLGGAGIMLKSMAGLSAHGNIPRFLVWRSIIESGLICWLLPNAFQIEDFIQASLDRSRRLFRAWPKVGDPALACFTFCLFIYAIDKMGGYHEFIYFRF